MTRIAALTVADRVCVAKRAGNTKLPKVVTGDHGMRIAAGLIVRGI